MVRTLCFNKTGGGKEAFMAPVACWPDPEILGNSKLQQYISFSFISDMRNSNPQVPLCSLEVGEDVSDHLFFLLCSGLH